MKGLAIAALAALCTAAATAQAPASEDTSCTMCHADADLFEPDQIAILADFADDVHAAVGISCHDCHGGNPDPALGDDMDRSMDPDFSDNPYLGTWSADRIPSACGRCHSDAAFMRTFQPDARIDQEAEYRISGHGLALAGGDREVATCVSCHSAHGIRRVTDPAAPVYPTRLAEMCGGCHSDAERMSGRLLADGRPMPVDQEARWSISVHARALHDRGDLSAPTCNDCHGNHGAAPPGFDSLSFVCGQCHRREADIFRASPKIAGLEQHAEYMEDAESCADCHEEPEPQVGLESHARLVGCSACHGNHAVLRPTVAMLAPLPDTPCAFCHADSGPESVVGLEESRREEFEQSRDELVSEGRSRGFEGIDLFDWLVDLAPRLPVHTRTVAGESGEARLRPEFERLFDKFRIGKTHVRYTDPSTGRSTSLAIRRCSHCHAEEPLFADAPEGLRVSAGIMDLTRQLTGQIGRAERTLLAARRGGVQTREAQLAVDRAVDAQIELEALVHTFSLDEEGELHRKSEEGRSLAAEAIVAADDTVAELERRRRGLAVALALIVLVLVALGIKIRQL